MNQAVKLYPSIDAFLRKVFTTLAKAGGVKVFLPGATLLPQRGGQGQQHGISRSDRHAWAAGVYGRLQRELPPEAFAALVIPYATSGEYPILVSAQVKAMLRDTGLSLCAASQLIQRFHRRKTEEAANDTQHEPLETVIQKTCQVNRSKARALRDQGLEALGRYKWTGDNKVLEHYGASIHY